MGPQGRTPETHPEALASTFPEAPFNPHSNLSSFKVTRPSHLGIAPSCLPVPPVKMCSFATFMSAPAQTLDLTSTATPSGKCSDSHRNPPILDFYGTTGLHTPGTVIIAREPCASPTAHFKTGHVQRSGCAHRRRASTQPSTQQAPSKYLLKGEWREDSPTSQVFIGCLHLPLSQAPAPPPEQPQY